MRRLALVLACSLALAGCSASPDASLRGDVESVIVNANNKDSTAVRTAVDQLLNTIREQVGSGDLTRTRGAQLRELALAVQAAAGSLDPVAPSESPSPESSPSPSVEPSVSPEPSPEPSPERSPSREPSPAPAPSEEPSPPSVPSDQPIVVNPLSPEPSPAQQVQQSPAAQRSAAASSSPTA